MRLISYELNGAEGVGVMVDDSGFVPAASAASDLPATMLGLLEQDGAIDALKGAADGRPSGASGSTTRSTRMRPGGAPRKSR